MNVVADRRLGGHWTPSQSVKNALVYVAIRLALAVADILPARLLTSATRALGRIAGACLWRHRQRATSRLGVALGNERARHVSKQVFACAGESLGIALLLRRKNVHALDLVRIGPRAREVLEAAVAERRGVVFVSAHLGPFELIAAAVAELGHRAAIVVRESYDPRLDAIVDRHRLSRGVEVIHRGAPAAAIRILRALRAGRSVGFLPDIGGRVPSVPARFLGRDVLLPIGAQRIAARTGAAVVVGTLKRVEGLPAWELDIEPIESGSESELTLRITRRLEQVICDRPEYWLWMADGPAEFVPLR